MTSNEPRDRFQVPNIRHLPLSPRFRIRELVAEHPYLKAIADRLPDDDTLVDNERVLAELFKRLLRPLRLTYDDALALLDHQSSPEAVVSEEFAWMLTDEDRDLVHDYWSDIWEDEADPATRARAQYYAALLARLYRLEPQVHIEAIMAAEHRHLGAAPA